MRAPGCKLQLVSVWSGFFHLCVSACVTSSSTAEAESLSASLVRHGKALKTVSTEIQSERRTALARRSADLITMLSFVGKSCTHAACWYPIVPRGIPPPHWWSGDNGSPTAGEVAKLAFTCDQCEAGLFESLLMLTISSSTLLDTATLKGWNLLMAEKADSSTSVCGSLRTQAHLSSYSDSLHAQSCERSQVRWYLAASRVPKVQYLTGILSLSVLRETITSVTSNRWGWEEERRRERQREEEEMIPCSPGLVFLFLSSACTAAFPSSSSSSSSSSLTKLWHHRK